MPVVFVIAEDWTLRTAVRAELREMGIEALGMESVEDAGRAIAEGAAPSAVVLEATSRNAGHKGLTSLARQVPVLVVASRTTTSPFPEQAAAVFYRPVRVAEIVARVKQLLEGEAA